MKGGRQCAVSVAPMLAAVLGLVDAVKPVAAAMGPAVERLVLLALLRQQKLYPPILRANGVGAVAGASGLLVRPGPSAVLCSLLAGRIDRSFVY